MVEILIESSKFILNWFTKSWYKTAFHIREQFLVPSFMFLTYQTANGCIPTKVLYSVEEAKEYIVKSFRNSVRTRLFTKLPSIMAQLFYNSLISLPKRGNRNLNLFHRPRVNEGFKFRICSGMKSCLVNIPTTGMCWKKNNAIWIKLGPWRSTGNTHAFSYAYACLW